MTSITKKTLSTILRSACACSMALMFHGCSLFETTPKPEAEKVVSASSVSSSVQKQVSSDEPIYATIGNEEKPFITESEFNVKLDQMLQMYRGQVTADGLPPEAKRKFLDDLIKMRTISTVWAENRDIASEADFRKMLVERVDAAKESAIVEYFVQELREGITVSDSEASADYKNNKEKYIKVAGGAQVKAISFDEEDAAKAFLKTVKDKKDEFEALAEEASKEHYKNYGFVSEAATDPQMGMMPNLIPEFVKKSIFASKKFPAVAMEGNGQKFWVYCALDRKKSEYFDLEEIKDQLKEMIKESKFKTVLDDRIQDLVAKAKIKINEDHFKRKPAPKKSLGSKPDAADDDVVIAA